MCDTYDILTIYLMPIYRQFYLKYRCLRLKYRFICARLYINICKGRLNMVSYVKLWKKLIDLGMKKRDLKEQTGIGSTTLTKLNNNEPVSMDVMIKICEALHCNIGEVMDIIYE